MLCTCDMNPPSCAPRLQSFHDYHSTRPKPTRAIAAAESMAAADESNWGETVSVAVEWKWVLTCHALLRLQLALTRKLSTHQPSLLLSLQGNCESTESEMTRSYLRLILNCSNNCGVTHHSSDCYHVLSVLHPVTTRTQPKRTEAGNSS